MLPLPNRKEIFGLSRRRRSSQDVCQLEALTNGPHRVDGRESICASKNNPTLCHFNLVQISVVSFDRHLHFSLGSVSEADIFDGKPKIDQRREKKKISEKITICADFQSTELIQIVTFSPIDMHTHIGKRFMIDLPSDSEGSIIAPGTDKSNICHVTRFLFAHWHFPWPLTSFPVTLSPVAKPERCCHIGFG